MSLMAEPKPIASLSSGLLARKGAARPAMRRQGLNGLMPQAMPQEDLGWNDMGYDVDPPHDAPLHDEGVVHYGNLLAGAIPDAIPATEPDEQHHWVALEQVVPDVVRQQAQIAERMAQPAPAQAEEPEATAPEATVPEMMVTEPLAQEPLAQEPFAQEPFGQEPFGQELIAEERAAEQPVAQEPLAQELLPSPQVLSVKKRKPAAEFTSAVHPVTPDLLGRVAATVRDSAPVAGTVPVRRAAFTLRLDSDRHLRLRLASAVTGQSAQQLVTAALDELLTKIPEIEDLASRVPRSVAR